MSAGINLGSVIVDALRKDFVYGAFAAVKGAALLDLGCGRRPFRELCDARFERTVALDLLPARYGEGYADLHGRDDALPLREESFDAVLCTEVMEHVREPKQLLREVRRVLKDGGRLILTTPFLVPLHDEPEDYYRYTIHGLRYLLEDAGFRVETIVPFGGMTAVTLSFLVQMQLKFWFFLSKVLRLGIVYSLANPFVLLFTYLPQKAYLWTLRRPGGSLAPDNHSSRLAYTTKGYGAVARK